jgi:predicted PolB exonuclease-like 3'-5' exonuclease
MTPILVFDIETIPDVAGIRRLEDLPATLSDEEVAEYAFAARREKTGGDFLPHHLQRVAAISCVFRDNNGFRVRSLGTTTDGEAALVQSF